MEEAFITKVSNSGTEEGNVIQKVAMVFKTVHDRLPAPGRQDRQAGRGHDLQLGHPGRHRLAIELSCGRGELPDPTTSAPPSVSGNTTAGVAPADTHHALDLVLEGGGVKGIGLVGAVLTLPTPDTGSHASPARARARSRRR